MKKGSGTRSGLLWEVERLIKECTELPQVLLMENVPQVHSDANMPDFQKWIDFLVSRGYSNYWQDLNAKDYGVAQNRERCFMVSILGAWNYKFPQPIQLENRLNDYLDDEVDERYYINSEKAKKLIQKMIKSGMLQENQTIKDERQAGGGKICVDLSLYNPTKKDICNCLTASEDRGISNRQSVGNGVVEWEKKF